MIIETYQDILSAKTRALIELNQRQTDLAAKESRKQELIAAIAQASQLIDEADIDAQSLQQDIAAKQRELTELEKSLSAEQQKVFKQGQALLNDAIDKAQRFNALIDEAESIWKDLSAELPTESMIVYRTCFDGASKPVELGYLYDFDWRAMPKFSKLDSQNVIQCTVRDSANEAL